MTRLLSLAAAVLFAGSLAYGCSDLDAPTGVAGDDQAPPRLYTKSDPFETDLVAGQHRVVGTVQVWNDGDYLYVTYVVTDVEWCLVETQLHVANSADDIPQMNGNPAPGEFDYKTEHECIPDFTYEIELNGWGDGAPLAIAAHAIVDGGDEHSLTLFSSEATLTAGYFERAGYDGTVDASFALAASNYSGGGTFSTAADISSPNANGYDENLLLDAVWVTSAEPREGSAASDQWRLFKHDFEIPQWATNITGSLQVTADNAVAAYLGDGQIDATTYVYDVATTPPQDLSVQHFSNLYGPTDFFPVPGPNSLLFVVRNYYAASDQDNNPTALLYRAEITFDESETAWGDGEEFGGNWAMYFAYTVQLPECQIYLSESFGGTNNGSVIYTVDLNGNAVLTEEIDLTGQSIWDEPQLAVHPGTGELYLLNSGNGTHLGVWDGSALTDLGSVSGLPDPNAANSGTVLAAFNRDGELYVANNNTNSLYRIDIDDLSAVGWPLPGIDVQGADMAFKEDGTLYLWSNANDGLWKITFDGNGDPETPSFLGGAARSFTGLAYGTCTGGVLIGSSNSADAMYEISETDGALTDFRAFELDGSPYNHIYGDMASRF